MNLIKQHQSLESVGSRGSIRVTLRAARLLDSVIWTPLEDDDERDCMIRLWSSIAFLFVVGIACGFSGTRQLLGSDGLGDVTKAFSVSESNGHTHLSGLCVARS